MLRSAPRVLAAAALLAPACASPTADPAPTPHEAPATTPIPGRILYMADDGPKPAIAAIPAAGGAPVDLVPGTGLYPSAVAPDGSSLAVITVDERGEDHKERLQLFPLTANGLPGAAGAGAPTWTSDPATHVRNPHWAPDGTFLAFEAAFHGFREIYRLDLPANNLRRLTDNPEGNFEPTVSPDNKHIAFVSSRDMNAEVYVMTAEGADQTRLTAFHMDDWGPIWAPDGKTLAFLSNRELIDRIYLMNPDGTDLRRLTPDKTPPPNPDGRIGGEPHETDPIYAADGSLAFCVRTGAGASLRIAVAGQISSLTDGQTSDRNPAWSPDSQHLVFVSTRDGGDLELYRITRAGKQLTRLTDRDGADWLPRWSPR
jgi:TolB protein